MGLGDADLLDDGDGGGRKVAETAVSCSICLEAVADSCERSRAKLQCGHEFHLDCIGSAFNIKGAMQCPNCRKIEKGQWLYANGSRPLPEFNFEDWARDEDLYDLSYSEMSFGLHWCPFTRVPTSFDEGEFSSSAYHDLLGPHAVFPEHTPVSSTSQPCPYITYFGPIHPSSSASSGSVSDGSTFNNNWNGPSGPTDIPIPYSFQSMDVHYQNWDQASAFTTSTRTAGSDQQLLIPPVTRRTARNNSDILRAGMHPFIIGHSSASRVPSSITSSVLPTYPGAITRPRDRPSTLQAYFQQTTGNPVGRAQPISTARRSSSHRGVAQVGPIHPSSTADQPSGFYLLSSSASSGSRTFQESENTHRDPFHRWEREHHHNQPMFQSGQADPDSIWGPFRPPGVGPVRHRHGSERMPPQNRPSQ
ncbi:RING/U-box superfamily protein [Striga hermonthica]|uniref:RING/U-box superfamily protein n=1 Tax=Striga hermonthica TaxID=68872 RepID=A0A9N7MWZ5_STRHE|nr:RING/U-box superfamily protein [Striga hermonthica]